MIGLFSKRFRKALDEGKIPYPSFTRVLRKRLYNTCFEFVEDNYWISDACEEILSELKKAYGRDTLRVLDEETEGGREPNSFQDFLVFAYPHQVIDGIEACYNLLSDSQKPIFQKTINEILQEEGSSWRLAEGRMYIVDSQFLDALKDKVEEEMKQEGYIGAFEEFRDARSYLKIGEIDDAIHKANRSYESVLMSILNEGDGTAADLLKKLKSQTDLLNSIPEKARKILVSKVLQGLPILRHKLGGHGQGNEVVKIPRSCGEFGVNLAATKIKFLIDLKKETCSDKKMEEKSIIEDNNDFPF